MNVTRKTWCLLWLSLIAFCLTLYVVLTLSFGLGNPWRFFGSMQLRALIPCGVLFLVIADCFRFVRVPMVEEADENASEKIGGENRWTAEDSLPSVSTEEQPLSNSDSELELKRPQPEPIDPMAGAEFFEQAQQIPHRQVPNSKFDREYLDLLGQSAMAGYAPALAKLGDYAIRRRAWIEAYFWMTQAKRMGMQNIETVMRDIRKQWSVAGFPNQSPKVTAYFTAEMFSIGNALLHLDSGHDAGRAREYLKSFHPEFL